MSNSDDSGEALAAWAFVILIVIGILGWYYLTPLIFWICVGVIVAAIAVWFILPAKKTR
ncbi:MAG TPA: hypothetical protein VF009_07010 [Solirubrobacterales bacterium]